MLKARMAEGRSREPVARNAGGVWTSAGVTFVGIMAAASQSGDGALLTLLAIDGPV